MPGFSHDDCKRIANVVRKVETPIIGDGRGDGVRVPQFAIRPFKLLEDLTATVGSADAQMQIPDGDGGALQDGSEIDPPLKVYAVYLEAGKQIPNESIVHAYLFGHCWQIVTVFACLEDIPEEE